jgi:transglutaminase-like putative cysteine protease
VRYQIVHTTTYTYDRPVSLQPHVLRLRPRCDGCQELHSFSLEVTPKPGRAYQVIDLEGNAVVRVWFQEPTDQLYFKVTSEVETHRTNPFDFLLEPWATTLPIDYPASLLSDLQPYFQSYGLPATVDSVVAQLAQETHQAVVGETVAFLSELNHRVYKTCQHTIRETGEPFPAALTWRQKLGSCRDLSVLFMEACRALGLAARFVSGYQEGDPNQVQQDLHAWAEVYLPGAGWRGYDPTNGIAVADRHVTLVASTLARHAAPVSGSFRGGGTQLGMQYHVSIQPL